MEPTRDHGIKSIPTRRQRRHSYDESVDQSVQLIESEAVEVEAEIPVEREQSVERSNQEDDPAPPAFEED